MPNREKIIQSLAKAEIATGIHYPIPFHLQSGYEELGYREGDFPITEGVAPRILSLPIYPEISESQIDYVCEQLTAAI